MGLGNCVLLYHFFVNVLAERLLKSIRKQNSIRAGDRLAVAISGGADSVALLYLILQLRAELGIVLSVAHVNHRLRQRESEGDADFVAKLAAQHELELHRLDAAIPPKTKNHKSEIKSAEPVLGLEAAARALRYDFFRQLARDGKVSKIATAHTLDDQAETVLLRVFRGTGIRGLAGIHPKIIFEEHGKAFGEVVRPLLGFRRAALQEFLREQGQAWREDSSNQDITFLRNRVRHRLLPLIKDEFGEAAIEHMSELAEIARAEDDHWQSAHPEVQPQPESGGAGVNHDTTGVDHNRGGAASLPRLAIEPLLTLPLAAQRRLMRRWLEMNAPEIRVSFRVIEEALEFTRKTPGKNLGLSARWNIRRERDELLLEWDTARPREGNAPYPPRAPAGDGQAAAQAPDYAYKLIVPGAVDVPELNARVEAQLVDTNSVSDETREQLFDIQRVPKRMVVRNWRAGDRFWPAHTASAKKIKELLNDRHATGHEKKLWPVAVAEDGEVIWLRDFAAPAEFQATSGSKAIWIRQIADRDRKH
jgi:tRNA(Ile)-lysidine synthase